MPLPPHRRVKDNGALQRYTALQSHSDGKARSSLS